MRLIGLVHGYSSVASAVVFSSIGLAHGDPHPCSRKYGQLPSVFDLFISYTQATSAIGSKMWRCSKLVSSRAGFLNHGRVGSLYTTYSGKWWTDTNTNNPNHVALALALSRYTWYLVIPVHSKLQSGVDYLVLIVTSATVGYCWRVPM